MSARPHVVRKHTAVRFRLTDQSAITLRIERRGRVVTTLRRDRLYEAGLHSVRWGAHAHGHRVPSGRYVAVVAAKAADGTVTYKTLRLRVL